MFTKSLLAGAMTFAVGSSFAAEDKEPQEQDIERIAVTGSQIKGVDLEGAQPLSVFSAEEISKSGATSISEFMQQVGQTRGGTGSFSTSESGATSTSTPAGQAAASLRGLGPSSTLTLVNGRRIAASSFAAGTQNFVDVNSIPLAAIERIEVLATGASAIYGADAVAGVINYILKKDYQGAEFNVSYGNSMESTDEGKYNLNFVFGTDLAGGQLTVYADYFDRNAFSAQDRDYTKDPILESSYSYLPKNTPNIYYWSARDGNEIGAPNCKTEFVTTEFGEEICAYYGNEDDLLQTELESASAGFYYNKEFGDIQWSTDFFYSQTKSTSQSTPAPIDQVDDSEGPWANETALEIFDQDTQDALFDAIYVDPYDTLAGQELWGFRYDARFGTPRTVEVETNSFRLVTGLSGEIGEWDWESAVTVSRSESEQTGIAGIYNRYKYHAVSNGELCSDGSTALFDGANLGCPANSQLLAMYNPFLEGDAANDALLAMAQEKPTRDGESSVYGWDAKITGELFELNDQTISAAFGVEYRQEEITDVPSLNSRARPENGYLVDVFGFGSSLSEAERTQYGMFAEFYWPLTDNLELQLAGRYDDYDDFGDTFNPKVGVTYRPIDSLVFRASWSTAFRAPSLTQAGVKLRTTTAAFDCGSNQAVADLYCEGFGDERRENVLELGNANLNPEESESVSVGFGFSPTDSITLTVDYWSFEHEDLVDTDMTALLDAAITDSALRHCGLVPNGSTGISYDPDLCLVTDAAGLTIEDDGANLTQILDEWVAFDDPRYAELPLYRDHVIELQNTGEQNVKGVDVTYIHDINLGSGRLSFDMDWTHYLEFERNKPGSDQIEELAGTWRYPENIASLRIGYELDSFYTSVTTLYTDSYEDDIEGLRGRELDELDTIGALDANGEREVDSWTTVNINLGYDFSDFNINLSLNNVLDEEPPTAYGSSRGFDSINHNALGANYRLSFTYFIK
ncbi:TonB-dependent receptor domain-containing protein [Thalassomonas sp. M1454]|uniref:TonB-dependent receptor domain-containing protein n=1 Tax=Thalassomonas sp. M1454 TaxID=2594477 RepID=UPI00117F5E82|nr:TonB-dependent receptor [Thalassomonas sp. M1454]TRX55268.1 TonB-dependent receptor [Thalassomonas sp. M1454]